MKDFDINDIWMIFFTLLIVVNLANSTMSFKMFIWILKDLEKIKKKLDIEEDEEPE